jgi:AcrR family transcriptional regulator
MTNTVTGSVTETAARRPGRPRDESIDAAILDATIDELIERGYPALSIEAIAVRAGVAKTTVYRRWPNLDDLVLQAMRSVELGGEDRDAPPGSVREELLFLLDRMRRTWADPRYSALMRRAAADGTASPEIYRSFRDRLIIPRLAQLHTVLRRGVEEGLIRPGVDLEWVRQAMTSPILAVALTHKDRVTRAQLAFTIDTVLAGLAP